MAEDLIFDRRSPNGPDGGYDPLHAFIALFENRSAEKAEKKGRSEKLEERLAQRIVDGDRQGLETDLDLAMESYPPLDIINNILLDGMKTVGELFGAGKMQLPFVLQSAETMKTCGALSRAAYGAGRGPAEGHGRAGDGARRRARHRQEPGRHHPDQQRLPGGQSRHQAADRRHPRSRGSAQGGRRRHVGAPGQIDRGHAREPRRDEPPGLRPAGHAGRGGADPALCRGGLRQGLCRGPRRLCAGRLRRARADGQDRRRRVRRASGRGSPPERGPPEEPVAQARPSRRPAAIAPRRFRRDPAAPRRIDPRRAGAAAALLGTAHDRADVAAGGRALSQRAHALPVPMGLPEGRQEPR